MSSVIKVILSILVALMIFLSGWICGSKNKEKRVKIEVKKAINKLLFLLEPIEGVSTAHIIENLNKNKDRLSKIQEGR